LAWEVSEKGQPLALRLRHRNYRPDRVTEVDESNNLELIATASFPNRNAIAVEFELVNLVDRDRTLTVSFDYPGKGVSPDWEGSFPAGHFAQLDNEPEGSWSTIFAHREHGRQTTWVKEFVTGMTEGTTLEMVCLADLTQKTLRLN